MHPEVLIKTNNLQTYSVSGKPLEKMSVDFIYNVTFILL